MRKKQETYTVYRGITLNGLEFLRFYKIIGTLKIKRNKFQKSKQRPSKKVANSYSPISEKTCIDFFSRLVCVFLSGLEINLAQS